MNILVCNAGSTSLKFKLYAFPQETVLFECRIERIGDGVGSFSWRNGATGAGERGAKSTISDYSQGIGRFLSVLTGENGAIASIGEIAAVGFKTVIAKGYGGVHVLDDAVLHGMREYLDIAPSHNAPYLEAIALFRELLPEATLVGVFETAFHRTIARERALYPLPYEWAERYGIRRYGYHGASHGYVARRMTALAGEGRRVISLHLGGSSSACAIVNGASFDTSFGFSLQTGLPHANRCGDVDAFTVPILLRRGVPLEEITAAMSSGAGLKGLSGLSGDMRDLEAARLQGDSRAALAIDVFVTAIVRYAGAFYAEMGGLDELVFTGGIGERSAFVREEVCKKLLALGVRLSDKANAEASDGERILSEEGSPVRVWVIPANEEIVVAQQTYALITHGN